MYDAATVEALGDLLRRKQSEFGTQIYLVSDEPYKKLLYDGLTYPEVHDYFDNSIAVTSHAKDLALPRRADRPHRRQPRLRRPGRTPGGPELRQPHPGVS